MKAIILERQGDEAAVLREDGDIVRVRVGGEVGETVELTAEIVPLRQKKKKRWVRSAVAAALALTVTGSTLGYLGTSASAYVSVDVEDSAIELTVNHFGRVIGVSALDQDAEALAESLYREVRRKPMNEALDHTMQRLSDEGYFGGDERPVIAGVTADSGQRAAALRQMVERSMEDGRPVYVSEMSRAERRQAMEGHMSPGRFGYVRDHGDDDWDDLFDDWDDDDRPAFGPGAAPGTGPVGGPAGPTEGPAPQGTRPPVEDDDRYEADDEPDEDDDIDDDDD